MQIIYFAWVRERIGHTEESMPCPDGVKTVGALLDHLAAKGEGYAHALEKRHSLRIAVNQIHVGMDHPVFDRDEVAIFPPVTGG